MFAKTISSVRSRFPNLNLIVTHPQKYYLTLTYQRYTPGRLLSPAVSPKFHRNPCVSIDLEANGQRGRRRLLSAMMNPSIVVIGAGASGVAASTYLLEQGHKNLIILEAENRIGGRVHTIPFAANVVDLGAQWCHGEKDNVVYELATSCQSDLLESNTAKYDRFELTRSDGTVVDQAISDKLIALAVSTVELYKDEIAHFDGSLGSFITKK